MECYLKEEFIKHTLGEQAIDEVIHSLLHQSSPIKGRLRRKVEITKCRSVDS